MMKKMKIGIVVLVMLGAASPSYALDVSDWFKGLFTPVVDEPVIVPNGPGTGGGDPPGPKPS